MAAADLAAMSVRRGIAAVQRQNRSWETEGVTIEGRTQGGQLMPIRTLDEAISHYGREAYLLTVAKEGPHTSNVTIELRGDCIGCSVGVSAAKNIAREPHVSLFWPPTEPGGYALIVNGTATSEHQLAGVTMAEIILTKSVLHRPGPKPDGGDGPCASDCRRLTRS
jgi:hypothetical protein